MKTSKNILTRLRKQFPQVNHVVDASTPILVSVTKKDSAAGRRKDPNQCALAKACMREQKADGAIIGLGSSYIIKGDKAIRYRTGQSIGREITSFDRHQDFAEGNDYKLVPHAKAQKLLCGLYKGKSYKNSSPLKKPAVHHTARVRTITK